MSWSEGYISEVDYTTGYFTELSPALAEVALLNRSIRTRSLARPTYLELGFGQGLSYAIHCATVPGELWGTDFNPGQAASTEEMVRASGSDARVLDASFAELAERDDLPEFDMIALHGIWSWIGPENRRVIVDIARKKLKPGGVFYVSYNVMPGWAPIAPLRHLLDIHASRGSAEGTGLLNRLDSAMEFAEKVSSAGALYFKAHPRVLERLQKMKDKNRKYLAHEFLNAEWHPMPFSQLVTELEPAKLSFAVSATLIEQVDGLHLSAEGQALVNSFTDVVLRETVRDFLANQQFRRDYFVRGSRRLPGLMQAEKLRAALVVLTEQASNIKFEVRGALGTAKLQESTYAPLVEALASEGARKKSLGELERVLEPKNIGLPSIVQAVTVLMGKNQLMPARADEVVNEVMPRTRALNLHLMDRTRANSEIGYLASPVTGTGIPVGRIDQLCLLARSQGKRGAQAWADSVWETLSAQGQRVLREGKRVEEEAENRVELLKIASAFEKDRLPVLERLGIA